MINKKVIRKENQTGKFTTTHHSILFDKRLKSNDKIILITILSDSDSFNITQQSLINRLDLKKVAIQTSMKNLEKFGYLKRKELKRGNYYIISEFGNLLGKDETETNEENPTINELPEPIIIETPTIEEIITELPIIELSAIEEKIDLNDYEDEIVELLSEAPIEKIKEILNYFEIAITKGTLNNRNQMTSQNIKKVIEKFIPKVIEVKCLNKTKLSEICDQNSSGNGMTQLNRKTVKNQIISYFSKNPSNSVKEVETKILKLKMNFSRVGELDPKYQN